MCAGRCRPSGVRDFSSYRSPYLCESAPEAARAPRPNTVPQSERRAGARLVYKNTARRAARGRRTDHTVGAAPVTGGTASGRLTAQPPPRHVACA